MRKRDYLDEHRAEGPLVKSADALLIDNSEMTIEEEVQVMLEKIEEKRRG